MSMTTFRTGGRVVLEKRAPLRDAEQLAERDRLMWAKYCERLTLREIGRIFGLDKSNVSRRLNAMPQSVRKAIRKDVERQRRVRLSYLRDEAEGVASHA